VRIKAQNNGSVFLIVVFAIVLMATITMGILEMTTEELQLMQNQLYATQAIEVAEAGLNDAFAQIRGNPTWSAGFTNKSFPGYGTYTVDVNSASMTITSTGTSTQGYIARIRAGITVGVSPIPGDYVIRIDSLRINE
jgi:Tfp pilus assembly protein PilX